MTDHLIAKPIARIDLRPRAVALFCDLCVCYFVALLVTSIPVINYVTQLFSLDFLLLCFFLVRDFLFEGRGIGKNLMGLRVVDKMSGQAPTLSQSIIRNIVLVAPCLLYQLCLIILRFLPPTVVNQFVLTGAAGLCTLYVVIVLPMEGYRVYSRADGLRWGDELAGTIIVKAKTE